MKHLEVSKKISVTKKLDPKILKDSLVERIGEAMDVQFVSSEDDIFSVKASTGAPGAIARHASVSVKFKILQDDKLVRILCAGYTKVSSSLVFIYASFIAAILAVGLLPGSIETGDKGGAMDALIFLLIGVYVVIDVSKKLSEPKEILEDILQSIDTEFG